MERPKTQSDETGGKRIAGWREWLALPELGVDQIKAKLDTGARTSALHAFDIEPFRRRGADWVRFAVHPMQRNDEFSLPAQAKVVDVRGVTNSGGASEARFFIETRVVLGGEAWPIEIGLTNRDEMGFRMLLGRTAMKGHLVVDAARSFLIGKKKKSKTKAKAKEGDT